MANRETYNFIIVLHGVSQPNETLEDALFEVGCDDALLVFRKRIPYLEFDREADNFQNAILSAIQDVESVELEIRVVRIEPDDYVSASEIARRIKRSREYVRLMMQGERVAKDFPLPYSGIYNRTLVWSWAEVSRWLFKHNKIADERIVKNAQLIREINNVLELRSHKEFLPRQLAILERLENKPNRESLEPVNPG